MNAEQNNPALPALYVVAVPIGNPGDITLRALECLRGCDLVLAEDTRKALRLFSELGIDTRVERLPVSRLDRIDGLFSEHSSVAIVSDAGTPGISDPGSAVVRHVRTTLPQVNIVPLPGANALSTALSVSGFQTNPTVFLGFLPPKSAKRKTILGGWLDFEGLLVIYESVHRIEKVVSEIFEVFGEPASLFIGREMTKTHEDYMVVESLAEFNSRCRPLKGEFTLVINRHRRAKRK